MSEVSQKAPSILRQDHLVLTCDDVAATVEWYRRVLGFEAMETTGRWALRFGEQKINLHQKGREIEPHALKRSSGWSICWLREW